VQTSWDLVSFVSIEKGEKRFHDLSSCSLSSR